MHVSLTERLEDYVREKVASGLYNNASEVIREALRSQIAAETSDAEKLQRLREAIDVGWRQADEGLCKPLDMQEIHGALDGELKKSA
ncbi:MAG: type II toxin-antitoxin system ParD family antitoxin [Pikeienuella sp.]